MAKHTLTARIDGPSQARCTSGVLFGELLDDTPHDGFCPVHHPDVYGLVLAKHRKDVVR